MSKNPAAVALGSMRSKRKALAAAQNGKLGGRPIGAKDSFKRARGKKTPLTVPQAPAIAPTPVYASKPAPKQDAGLCTHGREPKFCVYCKKIDTWR
jgi:hypothetical protein